MESDSDSTEGPQMEPTKTYYEDNGDPLTQMQNDPDLRIGDVVELGTNNQDGRRLLRVTGYTYDDITPVQWQGGRRRQRRTNKRSKRRQRRTNKRRRR